MTKMQRKARIALKENRKYMSQQQLRTLNGLIKAGDVVGAMSGMHTILAKRISALEHARANGI